MADIVEALRRAYLSRCTATGDALAAVNDYIDGLLDQFNRLR
jgi:hypothetical protein|tara:strand:+ start:3915 stop:4040 length:126 start_codon:yes stop_codon:yes gene_type:complete